MNNSNAKLCILKQLAIFFWSLTCHAQSRADACIACQNIWDYTYLKLCSWESQRFIRASSFKIQQNGHLFHCKVKKICRVCWSKKKSVNFVIVSNVCISICSVWFSYLQTASHNGAMNSHHQPLLRMVNDAENLGIRTCNMSCQQFQFPSRLIAPRPDAISIDVRWEKRGIPHNM